MGHYIIYNIMAQKRTIFRLMPANDSLDRVLTTLDEKQRAIFLSENNHVMPSVGIFDEPTRCFRFNLEWCKLVIGWLHWMTDVAFWHEAENEDYSAIRQMLIALEGEPCGAPEIPDSNCLGYLPYHSAYTYNPVNPFTEPNTVPSGYLVQPFVIAGINYPTLINDFGDVVVRWESFPINANWFQIVGGFLPEIIFTCTGIGQAEIKLQNQPFGGRVAITINRGLNVIDMFVDGILDTGAIFIELNQDFTSFPGESIKDISVELNFDVDETHEIHLTFTPAIDDSLTPLQFGGTFKGIHLCGLTPVSQSENIVNDIRVNGCNIEALIDGVWVNKGSVLSCVTGITNPMQTQIDQNTNDITIAEIDIQTLYLENDNQDTTLNDHENRIEINELNLVQNNGILSDHEQRIVVNETDIQTLYLENDNQDGRLNIVEANLVQNNGILSDHEQRIVTLENAPSGGGSGSGSGQNVLFSTKAIQVNTIIKNTLIDTWETCIPFNHKFTYSNALIIIEFRAYTYPAGKIVKFRQAIDTLTNTQESWVRGGDWVSAQSNASFTGIDTTQELYCELQFQCDASNAGRVIEDQIVQIAIWEFSDAPAASLIDPIVTFDSGGAPYTLSSGQVGIVSAGGNSGNSLNILNLAINEFIAIDLDLVSQSTISDIDLDMFLSDKNPLRLQIYIDSVLEYDQPLDFVAQSNVWHNHRVSDYSSIFPMLGTDIQVKLINVNGGVVSDARIDNISIDTGGV